MSRTRTYTNEYNKVIRLNNTTVIAVAGCATTTEKAVGELTMGGALSDPDNDEAVFLVVCKKGGALQIDTHRAVRVPCWYKCKFKWSLSVEILTTGVVTLGSGKSFAKAAFLSGKDGEGAIKIASMLDAHTGSDVDCMSVECVDTNLTEEKV